MSLSYRYRDALPERVAATSSSVQALAIQQYAIHTADMFVPRAPKIVRHDSSPSNGKVHEQSRSHADDLAKITIGN